MGFGSALAAPEVLCDNNHPMFNKIFKGNNRSAKVKKNILASFFIKGADTLISLVLVPLTLGYLNPYEYGIWLTLSSILSWINSFDVGLGSGLRNNLGTAMAEKDRNKARGYVSTTFFMLVFLTSFIFVLLSLFINVIDWYSILNVKRESVSNLDEVVIVSFFFFCLNFLLRFVGNVYQALQLPAINNLMGFVAHLLALVLIYILRQTIPGSLFWVAVAYSSVMPVVYLLCYPLTFYKLYPFLAPSLRYFRKDYLKDLFTLSLYFFVLQIMGLVLFSLSNVLISSLFGPDQVTPYNIAYRYFSLLLIFFNLLLAPIWAAATDAYAKNDFLWIRACRKKLNKFFVIIVLLVCSMVGLSGIVYKLWIGSAVEIPFSMSVLMGIYMLILLYSLIYSSLLNGMGKLRLQSANIVVAGMAFLPICYSLSKVFGVLGILMGMCLIHLSGALLNVIQLNKILNNTATGIWSK